MRVRIHLEVELDDVKLATLGAQLPQVLASYALESRLTGHVQDFAKTLDGVKDAKAIYIPQLF